MVQHTPARKGPPILLQEVGRQADKAEGAAKDAAGDAKKEVKDTMQALGFGNSLLSLSFIS